MEPNQFYNRFSQLIDRFQTLNVLVAGDLILDIYLKGDTTRLSPEAPVPVVDIAGEEAFLGGAANVAANIKALGARVSFCSVCGADEGFSKVTALFEKAGITGHCLIKDPHRKTIIKERILAGKQILVRFDQGTETDISEETEEALIDTLKDIYPAFDVVILADYGKGIFTGHVIKAIKTLQGRHPAFLAVDSRRLAQFRVLRPNVVKPNYAEAIQLLNLPHLGGNRKEQIRAFGCGVCKITGADTAVITLDADGAIAYKGKNMRCHVPAGPVAEPKVSGAGDTFISSLSLAMACGTDLPASTRLASIASAIAVTKDDTACCTATELRSFFAKQRKHITDLEEMKEICDWYHAQHKKIVFTNGCFDILHSGHVNYLNLSGKLGDILIVGINTDLSIKRLKGANRPVNPLSDRLKVVAAMEAVDHVISFGEIGKDNPIELIKVIRPDVFVKGGDYAEKQLPEASTVEQLGGMIHFIPLTPNHSTTQVIHKIHELAV